MDFKTVAETDINELHRCSQIALARLWYKDPKSIPYGTMTLIDPEEHDLGHVVTYPCGLKATVIEVVDMGQGQKICRVEASLNEFREIFLKHLEAKQLETSVAMQKSFDSHIHQV